MKRIAITCAALLAFLSAGCTNLHIQTPSGYVIKRTTQFNNRSEELTLYDPDTGKPLGEYKRTDEEKGTEALAVLAETVSDLADTVQRNAATGGIAP